MVELKTTKNSLDITSIINVTGREPEGSIKPMLSPIDCYARVKRTKLENGEELTYSEVTVSLKGETHNPHFVTELCETLATIHSQALRLKTITEFTAKCINGANHEETKSDQANGSEQTSEECSTLV